MINDRKRLLEFILNNKVTKLQAIRKMIIKEKLWFGPSTDYADMLLAWEASGEIILDLEKGEVIRNRRRHASYEEALAGQHLKEEI